ncbi:MAG TPA: acetoin utilization protein AcuC [Nocardioidaceae bacterium]|nr:acetoin utilization protein AcuC [Nocardioidaceae bacterium]
MPARGPATGCPSCVVFDEQLTHYNFGPKHPLAPVRVDLTMRLARSLEVVGPRGLAVMPAPVADDDVVASVHSDAYIDAVQRAARSPRLLDYSYGLGTSDNPTFAGMHTASAHVVGASVEAARQVWSGEVLHAANIAGGLHHAMPGNASGFCIYNDVAVAIQWLLGAGAQRVGYVDLDVHHGDGVQAVFYDDPRVLTISLHESPLTLFPGTGYPSETGGVDAAGSAVNVALPPGTGDAGWLRAFSGVVPPLLRQFAPDVLVTQQGCDSHRVDPLAHLELSVDGQRAAYQQIHGLAHELCEGRWLATGGGGYAIVDVVPRSWTHLLATVSGRPLDETLATPGEWREHVRSSLGRAAPERMTDGADITYRPWMQGFDPDNRLDRSVQATRSAVFPLNGLDPFG